MVNNPASESGSRPTGNLLEIWLSLMIQLFSQYSSKINKQMNKKNNWSLSGFSDWSSLQYNVAELHHGIVTGKKGDHGGEGHKVKGVVLMWEGRG